jgi:hypothetical protein
MTAWPEEHGQWNRPGAAGARVGGSVREWGGVGGGGAVLVQLAVRHAVSISIGQSRLAGCWGLELGAVEQRRGPQISNAAPLPPGPLVALCQGSGQELICEAWGEVPNFLGFYLLGAWGLELGVELR